MQEIGMDYFKWIDMENKAFLQQLLQALIEDEHDAVQLKEYGKEIYAKGIAFSQFAIYLDIYSYKLTLQEKQQLQKGENLLALGYLQERLPQEVKTLKLGIHNNVNLVNNKDLIIIEDLMHWLEMMVESFLYQKELPDISEKIEAFETFVTQRLGVFFDDEEIKENFLKTNKELYEAAGDAVRFFERKEYFYFVLTYIDMIAQFLKLVTLLGSMFLEEELLSIYIDPITMLPNRFQLIKDLQNFKEAYLFIVNIHSFSKLNLLYGYDFGDGILKRVANYLRLSDALKSYRIYGDEFAILVHSKDEVLQLFERLNQAIVIEQDDVKLELSFYGAYDKFEDKALERCEFALSRGEKRDIVDAQELQKLLVNYKDELTLIQKLKEAMIQDAIIPYYQPIYAAKPSPKVLKYEVLMRIRYDDEILAPGMFLETLKETPFYTEFTKSILLKSFELFSTNDLTFGVNFTLTDIKDKNVKLFLEALIAKYPQTAQRLTIEITETEALHEFDVLNDFIATFKRHGVKFALDDFGSGYSNFAQFAQLNIDIIKIDGSIVKDILDDHKMQKLLESIITFAKSMDHAIVAEYVSNKELFEYLKDKVDMLQGYYIGEPKEFLEHQLF